MDAAKPARIINTVFQFGETSSEWSEQSKVETKRTYRAPIHFCRRMWKANAPYTLTIHRVCTAFLLLQPATATATLVNYAIVLVLVIGGNY
mmetsp:Transcript_25527/g.61382  ORF Transcript_25527/g.61382 Transcript_25527/m.61382 type:complete len:91 (-) Transcript_25527:7-279(-)